MIYTSLTKKALRICFDAHKDQNDKSGMPYVFHPFHLAELMEDEYSTCVALLHDVVEDTDITLDDLRETGFPDEVIEAIALMTHEDSVPYFEYVDRLRSNPIAKSVKQADLEHNMDMSRMENPTARDFERKLKYEKAILILNGRKKVENFNLNGQEVPRLLGGGMNCPSAVRLTFPLT